MARPYRTHRDANSSRLVRGTVGFADTTVVLDALKAGDVVLQVWVDVLTVFNAGTTNVLTVGNTGSATAYLGTADVAETTLGVSPATGKGPFTAEAAATNLVATFAQTGTAATTGSAVVYARVATLGG